MKYLATTLVTGLFLTSSVATAQNYIAGSFPTYTDTLVNNASNNDHLIGTTPHGYALNRKQQRLYQTAVESLTAKRFEKASAHFDALLSSPQRIAQPSLSDFTYYLAGASHYFAGNDAKALPLFKRSVRNCSSLNAKQRTLVQLYVADIAER